MFGFLKDKLKAAVAHFNKRVDEEAKEIEEVVEKPAEKKPIKKAEPKPKEKRELWQAPSEYFLERLGCWSAEILLHFHLSTEWVFDCLVPSYT